MISIHDRGILASLTVGKTGNPKCSPLFPGVTPPTILVPHSIDSFAFAVALMKNWGQYNSINNYKLQDLTCLPIPDQPLSTAPTANRVILPVKP